MRQLVLLGILVLALGAVIGGGAAQEGRINITMWYGLGGVLSDVIQRLTQEFNESQDEILVESVFQASYDDVFNQVVANLQAGGFVPQVVHMFDLGTQTMIDSGAIVPVQELMDRDNFAAPFLPQVLNYYNVEGTLFSMPWNTSNPILYYNRTAFAEAGLDPDDPPETWEELREICPALTKRDADGNVTQWCFSWPLEGWFFEQFMATQGVLYANNNNGRTGRVTEVLINSPEGVRTMEFLTGLIADGFAPNLGRGWNTIRNPFFAQQIAMMLDSTSNRRQHDDMALANGYELGTGFLPHPADTERNGVIIGGGSLWLTNPHPQEEIDAAWEFIKFLVSPAKQIDWHINTGYFPARTDVFDDPELLEFWSITPNALTALNQLRETIPNFATQGAIMGPFPAIRQILIRAEQRVINDGVSAQAALDDAAAEANQELADYNRSIGL